MAAHSPGPISHTKIFIEAGGLGYLKIWRFCVTSAPVAKQLTGKSPGAEVEKAMSKMRLDKARGQTRVTISMAFQ